MSKLVLVTGASGFLASHIILELLAEGYHVRGTARGRKVEELRTIYASQPNVEIVGVEDIAQGQFPQIFAGVDAVIHTASPLAGRLSAERLLATAVEGSLNVLRQAEAAGITKFVVTSSIAAALGDPRINANNSSIKPEYWSPLTREQGIAAGGDMTTYRASKKFAELAVWDWADAHPHVIVTTILPPFLYGPIAEPSYIASNPLSAQSLSTNDFVYRILTPKGSLPPPGGYIDVRDAARAHVGALLSTPSSYATGSAITTTLNSAQTVAIDTANDLVSKAHGDTDTPQDQSNNESDTRHGTDNVRLGGRAGGDGYRRRVILASPHGLSWVEAVEIVRSNRPDLASRLNEALREAPEAMKKTAVYDVDLEFAERVTGLTKERYHSLQETILNAVDSLIKLEENGIVST